MGTSQSKPSARPGSPLVPSWAAEDPPPVDATNPPQLPPADEAQQPDEIIPPRRHANFRRALKQFMRSGNRDDARRALGHYSRGSAGSGSGGAQRMARASKVGGGVISALSNAVAGNTVASNGFDLASLTGRPVQDAINEIVDAFCPPGIIDEDILRASIGEALVEALDGLDKFDLAALDDHAVVIATRAFIAEMVFNSISADQGQSVGSVSPQEAVIRENDLRTLVCEVTDTKATPALQQAGSSLSQTQVEGLIRSIVETVFGEMSKW